MASLVVDDAAASRLRKLVAAKDAQIEGLTSRVEVLSDDLQDLRRERDYLVTTCARLEDCAAQCQEEVEEVEARERGLAAELAAANQRAEAAEAAQARMEADFAPQLAELKAVAVAEHSWRWYRMSSAVWSGRARTLRLCCMACLLASRSASRCLGSLRFCCLPRTSA